MRTRLLILLLTLIPCVACDQAAKALAVTHLKGAGSVAVVDGLVRLIYAENPGAFLGLGRSLPDNVRTALFTIGVAVLLLAVSVALVRAKTLGLMGGVGLSLLVAGGVGNLIDRAWRPGGRVVDYVQIGVGPVRTGIFNLADVHIVLGAAMVVLGRRRRQGEGEAPDAPDAAAAPAAVPAAPAGEPRAG
jgi:signal peptidase II